VVVHTYILYLEVGDGRIVVWSSLGKKLVRPYLLKQAGDGGKEKVLEGEHDQSKSVCVRLNIG
jgi:hypothetical protein